ncbi:MAG: hypothetical protein ACTHWF_12895 [Brachybacterium sp.]
MGKVLLQAGGEQAGGLQSVLFVCTGNICRSPYAEKLLQSRHGGLTATSSGIFALEGHPMDSEMKRELSLRNVEEKEFSARQVNQDDMEADLILTMSGRQQAYLLDEFPSAYRKTGLLGHVPELSETLQRDPELTARGAISLWSRSALPGGRDIPDPYRRGPRAAAAAAALMDKYISILDEILDERDSAPAHPT